MVTKNQNFVAYFKSITLKLFVQCTYSMTIFLETNCSDLPVSMNGHRFQEGCPGAVWFDGSPSKTYCQNDGEQFPWWETCCSWNGEQCVPKGDICEIIYIYIYI